MTALPAPQNAEEEPSTEAILLDLWQTALRVPIVAPDDDFFDLGGDSLMAVNLFLEIEKQTGVELPITAIYDAPTVARMAALIDEERDGAVPHAYSPLVLLKPGSGRTPLYIAHGIGGTVIELAALGRAIRIPDAVYALQAQGLDGRDPPHETIEAMVEHYLEAIRTVQPFGPYRLCGYSFGGLIAMEMARRLQAQGHTIAALILIDAYAHPSTWPVLSRVRMRLRRAIYLLGRALRRSPLETLSHILARRKDESPSRRLHEWLLDQNPSLPPPLLRVREAGSAALGTYRPKPYTGRIVFLKAKRRDAEFPDDPRRIWQRLALNIAFRSISGGHRTIVTDHAEATATAVTACLVGVLASTAEQKRSGGGPAKHRRGRLVATPIAPSGASHHLPRAMHARGRQSRERTTQ